MPFGYAVCPLQVRGPSLQRAPLLTDVLRPCTVHRSPGWPSRDDRAFRRRWIEPNDDQSFHKGLSKDNHDEHGVHAQQTFRQGTPVAPDDGSSGPARRAILRPSAVYPAAGRSGRTTTIHSSDGQVSGAWWAWNGWATLAHGEAVPNSSRTAITASSVAVSVSLRTPLRSTVQATGARICDWPWKGPSNSCPTPMQTTP